MRPTRRRFLLCAAAAVTAGQFRPVRWEWRGAAMGAEARIVLAGPRDRAEEAANAAAAEVERLEDIFSLHRPMSELSRLNAAGALAAPSRDLRDALAASARWRRLTDGAFDPAVQPLWRLWATGSGEGAEDALSQVRGAALTIEPGWVAISPGAAITLNGVAQGIVADRVAELLIRRGFTPRFIDTGEMRIIGSDRQAVILPEAGLRLRLVETAAATSAPEALVLDAAQRRYHLFDPRNGASPDWWRSVTVIAPTAAEADALSTAFVVSSAEVIGDVASSLPSVAVVATDRQGRARMFGAEKLLSGISHA